MDQFYTSPPAPHETVFWGHSHLHLELTPCENITQDALKMHETLHHETVAVQCSIKLGHDTNVMSARVVFLLLPCDSEGVYWGSGALLRRQVVVCNNPERLGGDREQHNADVMGKRKAIISLIVR